MVIPVSIVGIIYEAEFIGTSLSWFVGLYVVIQTRVTSSTDQ